MAIKFSRRSAFFSAATALASASDALFSRLFRRASISLKDVSAPAEKGITETANPVINAN
nr:hypothetical protein [Morganella morganii]